MLENDGSVSIHKRNLRFLACEMFKLKRDMTPELIKELILPNRQRKSDLRNNPAFAVPMVKSVHKGLESLSYLGPKIWELILPLEIKETETFHNSKLKLKSGIQKTVLAIFAKYTCRMLDSFRLVYSVSMSFLSWISLSS